MSTCLGIKIILTLPSSGPVISPGKVRNYENPINTLEI